jgi:gamma-glutamyltranspeptidase / glutathione hydrolase
MRIYKIILSLVVLVIAATAILVVSSLYLHVQAAKESAWPAQAARGAKAMVVSDERLADQAGVEILRQGGNAVDAAVAVAFALAVVEPEAGNIGGGGFMLVRQASGQTAFVDYREVAPQAASRDMYSSGKDEDASTVGYRAVAVPGTVAGLSVALGHYGTMNLAKVMQPAIRLAEQGFPLDERMAANFDKASDTLSRFPVTQRIFLNGGAGFKEGDLFKQPELAATLKRIAANGPDEFYRGETARHLAEDMAKNHGLIAMDDLAGYTPRIREPLHATYKYRGHDWELITSPPPSSGGIAIIEMMNILDPVTLRGWDDAESVHWVAEAMRRAFADRAAWLGDSDFAQVPVSGLTNPKYAAKLRAMIDPQEATPSAKVRAGDPLSFETDVNGEAGAESGPLTAEEARAVLEREGARGGHTTHFSVVDAAGNAVSNTYTLNDWFGSAVTSPDGFLLNDEMDDFTTQPGKPNMFGLIQSQANAVGPGKRPLSSMTPTIVLEDGKLSFVTGSPGGPTIISATLLTILNWMRLGMDAQQAINAPRFHNQWQPDELKLESTFPLGTAHELSNRGYDIEPPFWQRVSTAEPFYIGQVEAIGIDPKTGERLGAADPRRGGAAVGY